MCASSTNRTKDSLTPSNGEVSQSTRWDAVRSTLSEVLTFLRRNPLAVVGLSLIVVMLFGSLLAPLLTPYDPNAIDIRHNLEPPSLKHPLGTDFFGRDVLSRILYGGRNTLRVGVMVIGLAFMVGVPLGIFSGFVGGRVDMVLMRLADAMLSFPALVLAITLAAALGPSLFNAMLAVSFTLTPQFARVARGQALSLRSMLYVKASISVGASRMRILRYHILPNSLSPLIVQATISLGSAILQTASLGFLGLGAQPPTPEWGADVAANSQFLRESPWVAIFPGLVILISVLGFNLLGDALVAWSDPRIRQSR
jgi:peptide/nickel transport system permease protein